MVFITFIIPGARARFLEAWLACVVREGRALKGSGSHLVALSTGSVICYQRNSAGLCASHVPFSCQDPFVTIARILCWLNDFPACFALRYMPAGPLGSVTEGPALGQL